MSFPLPSSTSPIVVQEGATKEREEISWVPRNQSPDPSVLGAAVMGLGLLGKCQERWPTTSPQPMSAQGLG